MFADETAARFFSDIVSCDRYAVGVYYVYIEESAQRVRVLYRYRYALGFEQWQRCDEVGFVAGFEVELEEGRG